MLTLRTMLGAGWSVLSKLSGRSIDFATVLILARILTPADFGLVALAMTIVSVLDIILEVPLMQALTRLQEVEKSHLDTAFTLGIARGAVLAAIVAAIAVPFSRVYSDSRLVPLVLLLSTGPLARGLYSPAMSNFFRQLSFRQAFIADTTGKILASTASIAIVLLGGRYWGIAANLVLSSVLATVISYVCAPYRPALSVAKFQDFSRFLGWFSAGQVVAALNWQLDRVLLGQSLSHEVFGQYAMSADLAVLPTQSLIGPAMQPVMAAFSTITTDFGRLQAAFLKAARFTMLLALPACVGISLSADLIVAVLLGPKWSDAAFFLRWLALPIGLTAYLQPLYSLMVAMDKFQIIFRLNLLDLSARLVLLIPALLIFGVDGVIGVRALLAVVIFVLCMLSVKSVLGLGIGRQLTNLRQGVAACIVMASVVLCLRQWREIAHIGVISELGVIVVFGALAYLIVLYALGVRVPSRGWR